MFVLPFAKRPAILIKSVFTVCSGKCTFAPHVRPIVAKTFFSSRTKPSHFFGGKTAAATVVVLDNFRKGRDRRRKRLKWPPLLRGFMLSGSSRRYYPTSSVRQSRCAWNNKTHSWMKPFSGHLRTHAPHLAQRAPRRARQPRALPRPQRWPTTLF